MAYTRHENVWSAHSRRELDTCHPDLVTLATLVLPYWDLKVQEGFRPKHEQDLHFIEGRSNLRWPDSKHNKTPSEAAHFLPFVGGQFIGWEGVEVWHQWHAFAGLVIGIAIQARDHGWMDHDIRWGGDWDSDWKFKEHSLRDLAHWELV